jgi:hypothetical protein
VSTDPTAPPINGNGNGRRPAFPDHPDWAGPQRFAAIAAVAGLGLYLGAGLANLAAVPADKGTAQFFLSWLVGYVFWLSLPIGGMALLFIYYLAKTSWGLLLKRFLEAATRTWPLMAALFVPVVVGANMGHASPYWWSDPAAFELPADAHAEPTTAAPPKAEETAEERRARLQKAADAAIQRAVVHERRDRAEGTYGFLSPPVFIACWVLYFAIWGALIFFLNKWSREADDPARVEASLTKGNKLGGPGLIIFAIVGTAAASQWVMSLEPSWASTMFPVIYSVNQFLTCFAFCVAVFLTLADRPPLNAILRPKFQIDMGSLMLAFTLFWSYTSFSQFMLVWIGNLPEEIPFFLKRSAGGWWWVSAALIAFHFALPFLLLLFRDIKMHPKRLRAVAIYLLVICAIDVMWWITPAIPHEGEFLFVLMDIGALAGIGGVWGLYFIWQLRQRPLLPVNETYMLPEGHAHEHH